jgi:UDP-N-acetylmuramate dehydrogenase
MVCHVLEKVNFRQSVLRRPQFVAENTRGEGWTAEDQGVAIEQLAADLEQAVGPAKVQMAETVARYTALRVGGPADLLCPADSADTLCRIVRLAWDHGVPCLVLGGGSNVLVSDAGVRGLVILNRAREIAFTHGGVRSESGASFSTLARQAVARGLSGLEWATGIPGTVGGAIVGNAGAWGGDVASVLTLASVLDPTGEILEWPVERFDYGYRSSKLKKPAADNERRPIVLEAQFKLCGAEPKSLHEKVARIGNQRRASQPPGASCGSVFKNPQGDYAGRLIEAADLKGKRKGGAEISTHHANFIVNRSQATANDIKGLIDLARETVQERFGIGLELEIELIGEW